MSGAASPIGFFRSTKQNIVTSATSAAIDTRGAGLIIVAVSGGSVTAQTDSLNPSGNWKSLTLQSGAPRNQLRLFYLFNPITGAAHTFTNSTANGSFIVACFYGTYAQGVDPFLAQSGASSAGVGDTTINPGSVSTQYPFSLFVTAMSIDDPAGNTMACTGFTIIDTFDVIVGSMYGVSLAYKVQGITSAPENPAWSRSLANTQTGDNAVVAVFRATDQPVTREPARQLRRAA